MPRFARGRLVSAVPATRPVGGTLVAVVGTPAAGVAGILLRAGHGQNFDNGVGQFYSSICFFVARVFDPCRVVRRERI